MVADGRSVHVVDDLSAGRAIQVPAEAELHRLDVRHASDLDAIIASVRPTAIFHLAAQADVRRALAEPAFDAEVNVLGTIAVLEGARKVGARVLVASTGGAGYGEYPELPVPSPETAETRPLSHYGMSKMAGEGYCGVYGRLYRTEWVALRLANVYGPRQDPHGEAGVVAIFCGRILDGEPPRVFGDGRQTRDYVYVADVVRAFAAAEQGPAGEVVNVGAGREVSVIDLLHGLGYEREPDFAPARPGELMRSALDVRKAEALWGWRASTTLADGLRTTAASVAAARAAPGSRPPGAFASA
jgi:UDP-glucose 4-epimerase